MLTTPKRAKYVLPSDKLEILVLLVMRVLYNQQTSTEIDPEPTGGQINTIGSLCAVDAAGDYAKAASGAHVWKPEQGKGIIPLARRDQIAAVAPFLHQRKSLDIGDEVTSIDARDKLSFIGCLRPCIKAPNTDVFLTHVENARARIDDAPLRHAGKLQSSYNAASRLRPDQIDRHLVNDPLFQHRESVKRILGLP